MKTDKQERFKRLMAHYLTEEEKIKETLRQPEFSLDNLKRLRKQTDSWCLPLIDFVIDLHIEQSPEGLSVETEISMLLDQAEEEQAPT